MALESLLEDAFRRGCGISRSYALRTPRYKELVETVPHITYTNRYEAAEMMYLGERLADRAFANLPYSIRERAKRWPEMSDLDRHQLLNALTNRLTSKRWKKINATRSESSYNTVSSALPAECGSWARGEVLPNCLGMSQMLIGFARATGADHLLVDTLLQHDHYNEYMYYMTLSKMIRRLKSYRSDPGIAQLLRRLEAKRLLSAKVLAGLEERKQAHHALAIKVGEDWVLVDPYLGTKYHIDGMNRTKVKIHADIMKAPRRRWMMIGARQVGADLHMADTTLENALKAYSRRNQPLAKYRGFRGVGAASATLAWVGVEFRKDDVTKARRNSAFNQALVYSTLSKRQLKEWWATNQKPSTFDFEEQIKRVERSKRARNAMLKRLVRFACLVCLDTVYNAASGKKREHRRIELAHPTLHLAVMTLNHLGEKTGHPVMDLLRFDSSQWIIHDTLGEVAASDNATLQKLSETYLKRVRKYPYLLMPELLEQHYEEE